MVRGSMIIHSDCLTFLKQLKDDSHDCVITSPPYNKKGLRGGVKTSENIWKGSNVDYDAYGDDMQEEEYRQWQKEILNECYRIIKPGGSIFYNHKIRYWDRKGYHPMEWLTDIDAQFYQEIVWWRKNTMAMDKRYLFNTTERIYWFCKGKPNVYKEQLPEEYRSDVWHINPDMRNPHPAPFPEKLAELCVLLSTQEGDLIFDPFVGSGTVASVCKNLNREFCGTEIDEKYVQMARDRITPLPEIWFEEE